MLMCPSGDKSHKELCLTRSNVYYLCHYFSSSFSWCSNVKVLCSWRQTPIGEWTIFTVSLPPGPEPPSFANILNLCLLCSFTSSYSLFCFSSLALVFSSPSLLLFTTVYAKRRFVLSLLACGWPKKKNKPRRTHIHSRAVCARPTST